MGSNPSTSSLCTLGFSEAVSLCAKKKKIKKIIAQQMVSSVVVRAVLEFMSVLAFVGNFLSPRKDAINGGISGVLSRRRDGISLSGRPAVVVGPGVEGFNRGNLSLWPEITVCPFP